MPIKEKLIRKAPVAPPRTASVKTDYLQFIPVVFVALYLFVDFVPEEGGIDVMGSQWVFLVVINFLSTGYIFFFSKDHGYEPVLKRLFSKFMCQAYLAFLVVAGISILFAINKTEALVNYTGVIVAVVAFFNIGVLLTGRLAAFKIIAQIISIILLIQASRTLMTFFNGIDSTQLGALIGNIKGNTGNKNIFAASMAVKLSFVMYCVYSFRSWARAIHIPALILGAIALFFVNARSAYLGLILEAAMFVVFVLLQYFKAKRSNEILVRAVPVVVSLIVAFGVAQVSLISAEGRSVNITEGEVVNLSVTERLKSLTVASNNQTRLNLWAGGWDYIKQHPFIGAGIGNCKLAIIPYEREFIRDFQFAKHTHQDFIQITMETGIVGGLLFLSLFVCALVYTIRVWTSNARDEVKVVAVFSLIALAGYTIDALFNFPAERPIMQLLFALILAVNVASFMELKDDKAVENKPKRMHFTIWFGVASIILLLDAAYYKYFAYRSLVAQSATISDFPNGAKSHWRQVNHTLPDVPNLDANNIPIDVIRAWYLLDDKKYNEAMVLLNRSTNVNPYNMANEFVKSQVFLQENKLDSAWYYASKSFKNRPNNVAIYTLYNNLCMRRGDTLAIHKAFKECVKLRPEPMIWNEYINVLSNMQYNSKKLLATIDTALKYYPNERAIQERNYIVRAGIAYKDNKIDSALVYFSKLNQLNPADNTYTENVGICYYVLKQYDRAIPYFDRIIVSKAYANGKPEYFKGICLSKIGKQEQACYYLKVAENKGFPQAKNVASVYCR